MGNLFLSGTLVFEPRGAWKLVATSTLLANNPERRITVARGHSPELVGVHIEAVSAVPRSNQSVNSQRVELLEALIGFILAHPDEQTGV
jgi:hypothetical protein